MERFNFVFVVAGFVCFAIAFVIMAILPIAQYSGVEVVTIEQLSQDVPYQFEQLAEDYPAEFAAAFPDAQFPTMPEKFAEAIRTGNASYIAEACWHCHTQQIRRRDPNKKTEVAGVGGDIARWASDTGSESIPSEYFNEMNYPHLFGTRRIGPDLIRESGRHSNDWHLAHFWNPRETTPYSVMPSYRWFYDDDQGLVPNKRGLSMVAYLQWLGSWHTQFAPSKYDNLPDVPYFDETKYPVIQMEINEGGDDYGDAEEDY